MSDGLVIDFNERKSKMGGIKKRCPEPRTDEEILRACFDDILEVLKKHSCRMHISARIVEIGPNVYQPHSFFQIQRIAPDQRKKEE